MADLIRRIETGRRPALPPVRLGWAAEGLARSAEPADAPDDGSDTTPAEGPLLPADALAPAQVHEWIGPLTPGKSPGADPYWRAPLAVLIHAAARLAAAAPGGWLVWIGRRAWPHPHALAWLNLPRPLLERSLFVDASDPAQRLWAADLSLRAGVAAAVIADGSGFDVASTRRLQLAAEQGAGPDAQGRAVIAGAALLARPPAELRWLSAAATRWLVRRLPGAPGRPRWEVELMRSKGARPSPGQARTWNVEWRHAHGLVAVPAEVDGGTGVAPEARAAGA